MIRAEIALSLLFWGAVSVVLLDLTYRGIKRGRIKTASLLPINQQSIPMITASLSMGCLLIFVAMACFVSGAIYNGSYIIALLLVFGTPAIMWWRLRKLFVGFVFFLFAVIPSCLIIAKIGILLDWDLDFSTYLCMFSLPFAIGITPPLVRMLKPSEGQFLTSFLCHSAVLLASLSLMIVLCSELVAVTTARPVQFGYVHIAVKSQSGETVQLGIPKALVLSQAGALKTRPLETYTSINLAFCSPDYRSTKFEAAGLGKSPPSETPVCAPPNFASSMKLGDYEVESERAIFVRMFNIKANALFFFKEDTGLIRVSDSDTTDTSQSLFTVYVEARTNSRFVVVCGTWLCHRYPTTNDPIPYSRNAPKDDLHRWKEEEDGAAKFLQSVRESS